MNPIFPSILSTNFYDLHEKLSSFAQNKIDHLHLDVMDGHFVPNISFGPSILKAIKSRFSFKIDAHLMVTNPAHCSQTFIDAGADWISFHMETSENIAENIAAIKKNSIKVGLALNPDCPPERVFPYLPDLDYVLLMSVFPGYGGQRFIDTTIEKVSLLRKKIDELGAACLIQVDGGINTTNIKNLRQAGADLLVIGTFLYNTENMNKTIQEIQGQLQGD
jgi:ribulose-phosphate 3-epimerase